MNTEEIQEKEKTINQLLTIRQELVNLPDGLPGYIKPEVAQNIIQPAILRIESFVVMMLRSISEPIWDKRKVIIKFTKSPRDGKNFEESTTGIIVGGTYIDPLGITLRKKDGSEARYEIARIKSIQVIKKVIF